MQHAFKDGNIPAFTAGVTLEEIDDDGSAAFDRLYERVRSGDVQD
jgi:hypothetical protein